MDDYSFLIFVGIGIGFQLLTYLTPFREQTSKKAFKWDLVAALASWAFAVAFWLTAGNHIYASAKQFDAVIRIREWTNQIPLWQLIIIKLFVSDFIYYWCHRLLHTQIFWHHHAFHHSPKHLWWLSGLRAAPLHVVCLSIPAIVSLIFFPATVVGSVALGFMILGALNQHWLHSNVRFPFAKYLEYIIITPRFHFVHHHIKREQSDSNYGFIFSIWDRLFGTYTNPQLVHTNASLGLNYKNSEIRLLLGLQPKIKLKPYQSFQKEEAK